MTRWKSFRYRLEEIGCRLLAAGVPRLSRRACVAIAHSLGTLAYYVDGRGRSVALANLEAVFGDRFSDSERRMLARQSYRNFARTMLDLFWASRLNGHNFAQYLHLEGFEELKQRLEGRSAGAVFFCVHQGNWEWASLAFGFLGLSTSIVAENFKNPLLTSVFSEKREVSGHTIIPQENSLIRLLKVVKRGGWAGLLIDLNLRPSQATTVIKAFESHGDGGLEMCVPVLHALLAQRIGALLIPVETEPLPDGSCRVRAMAPVDWPPGATLQEIAQRCWDAFEPTLQARPGEWLSAYKHFRYRPAEAIRDYPFYSNHSRPFEKLRARLAKERPTAGKEQG
jgi:lauroyl/myristoyl acyltransferase